jgi:hypothetical protein
MGCQRNSDARLAGMAQVLSDSLIMAADSIAGYIQGLLDGVAFTHPAYALDRDSRKAALAHFLGEPTPGKRAIERSAA